MTKETLEKMSAILNENEERAKKLLMMTPKEAANAFSDLGCEVTEDEIYKLGEAGKKILANAEPSAELSAEDLSDVAGGDFWRAAENMFWGTVGAGTGMLIGVGLACLGW